MIAELQITPYMATPVSPAYFNSSILKIKTTMPDVMSIKKLVNPFLKMRPIWTKLNASKENLSPFVLEPKWNNKIMMVHNEPSTLAMDAPAIPMFKGNTNTISNITFNTPPETTAIIASFGAPSFLTKVCKNDENEKALNPRMTKGA